MRLLITDEVDEFGRWVEVTGLGQGVDATGRLGNEAMERTLAVLTGYGRRMDDAGVDLRAAMATSATRDASNRDVFIEGATSALGVGPDLISGDVEGALAYAGATSDLGDGNWVVSDIGGGSSEFVTADAAVSIDIGSVRLTDRILADRPPMPGDLSRARRHVSDLFAGVDARGDLVGVAGTWTSLAAIDLDLDTYAKEAVHHHRISREGIEGLTERLASMTVEETASIPSLDPKRAPVILAGAVVAGCVMDVVGADSVLASERDTLDGLARQLLGLR